MGPCHDSVCAMGASDGDGHRDRNWCPATPGFDRPLSSCALLCGSRNACNLSHFRCLLWPGDRYRDKYEQWQSLLSSTDFTGSDSRVGCFWRECSFVSSINASHCGALLANRSAPHCALRCCRVYRDSSSTSRPVTAILEAPRQSVISNHLRYTELLHVYSRSEHGSGSLPSGYCFYKAVQKVSKTPTRPAHGRL
jgi:hypothetical protein